MSPELTTGRLASERVTLEPMKLVCLGACALVLAACSSGKSAEPTSTHFAKAVEVAPHVRLWLACSGSGPVVLEDGGLGSPTEAWAGVRRRVGHLRFCGVDRAGVGRSDVRSCACGSLGRNVEDIHALVRAAHLKPPLILVGHSTGGLDALLYSRRYRSEVAGLVLVDAPSESAPAPPGGFLYDGLTKLDFVSGLRELRNAPDLGDLPILVISHGKRAYSTVAAERSWTAMQRQLAADSSNTLRVVALESGHLVELQQPRLVAAAISEVADVTPRKARLRCVRALVVAGGRCVA
jgi:pimeloyl-ACP methyl ester carboxylesterase